MRTIIGLDGKSHVWNFTLRSSASHSSRSKHHISARELISELYPGFLFYEEVSLPGSRQKGKGFKLFLDFFIPMANLAVEVHGNQHYEYIPFFHKNKLGFIQSQNRDDDKTEWCDINNIDLVTLKYSDSKDEWTKQLKRGTSS